MPFPPRDIEPLVPPSGNDVRASFPPEAEARFGTNLESRVRDIAEKENFLRLLVVLDRADVKDNESVYLVFPQNVRNLCLPAISW